MNIDLSWLRTTWFHYLVTDISTQNGIVPEIFGYEQCNPKKNHIVYDKDCYSLHFVIKGKGYVDNQLVKAGDCFLLSPHCQYEYYPNPRDPYEYVWVEFNGYTAERFVRHAGFVEHTIVLKQLQCLDVILENFRRILIEIKVLTNKHARTMLYEALTIEMLGLLAQEKGYEVSYRQKSISEVNIQKIFRYIDAHYSDPNLTVSSIAEAFFYVPSYLTRLFKKYAGINPNKYITKLRMEKAISLLANRNLSIEQISTLVGYKNPFYFSKEFKRYYGVSPTKYQEGNKSD